MMRKEAVVLAVAFAATLAFSLCVGTAAGQSSVTEEFNNTYGESGFDGARSVVQTQDGGYALAGSTDFGSGNRNAFLIKTDSNGDEEFAKIYGGSGRDEARSVVQTQDGGYALAGSTESFGPGNEAAWLIKTDGSGTEQWNETYGESGFDGARSVTETFVGGYALVGSTDFGSGISNAFLIRTDENGTEISAKTYGGPELDRASSVIETVEPNPSLPVPTIRYALAGETQSFGSGSGDAWLIRTDANGNELWNETYGGSSADESESVVGTSDGGFALTGGTQSFGSDDPVDEYAWLIKTDGSGTEQWNETYGAGLENARSLVETSDGGYALAGRARSFGSGGDDAWLIKTDASGQEQFNETYGGSSTDEAESVVETSDGGYALAGSTDSFGPGGDDAWLIKASKDLFTSPLIDRFENPPTNTDELGDPLYDDLDGDGSGTDVDQTVAVFGELIRGKDLNGDAPDGGLTDEQARALNWNQGSPETEVTPADMVSLFGEQIRAE